MNTGNGKSYLDKKLQYILDRRSSTDLIAEMVTFEDNTLKWKCDCYRHMILIKPVINKVLRWNLTNWYVNIGSKKGASVTDFFSSDFPSQTLNCFCEVILILGFDGDIAVACVSDSTYDTSLQSIDTNLAIEMTAYTGWILIKKDGQTDIFLRYGLVGSKIEVYWES